MTLFEKIDKAFEKIDKAIVDLDFNQIALVFIIVLLMACEVKLDRILRALLQSQ